MTKIAYLMPDSNGFALAIEHYPGAFLRPEVFFTEAAAREAAQKRGVTELREAATIDHAKRIQACIK